MIALGIDPGTRRIGYGVVECNGPTITFVTAGILAITSTDDVPALEETKKGIDALIKKHKPDVVAIEKALLRQEYQDCARGGAGAGRHPACNKRARRSYKGVHAERSEVRRGGIRPCGQESGAQNGPPHPRQAAI